jgi:hypothetical protein
VQAYVRFAVLALGACGVSPRGEPTALDSGAGSNLGSNTGAGSGSNTPCTGCYLVYAHSDTTLYVVDVQSKTLNTVGAFNAPTGESITDLAVAPDNTIYVISEKALYTANATDGHVSKLGSLSACGTKGVALTTTPDGKLWTGDYTGTICQIDLARTPPVVLAPVSMSSGLALTGDFAAVADGTVFGTAYKKTDTTGHGSQLDNLLVKIDVATGAVTAIGSTGYPKLFGVAFAANKVFGFTHDGTGDVVTIDPVTGAGTLFGTFLDPATSKGISFGGAGVNSTVPIIE